MKLRTLLLFASYTALTACGDTTSPSGADAAIDSTPDVTRDVTLDTADVTAPDAPVDDIARTDAASDRVTVDTPPTDTPLADTPLADTPLTEAGACNGANPGCVSGTAGGTCGDAISQARCVGTAWQCEAGSVFPSQCACVGRPPGACTCGPSGWICDAGVAPDASSLVDCDPSHALCDRIPPVCAGGGEVASVSGSCWGPCVLYTRCLPIACNPDAPACPTNLVCYRTTRLCGPPL